MATVVTPFVLTSPPETVIAVVSRILLKVDVPPWILVLALTVTAPSAVNSPFLTVKVLVSRVDLAFTVPLF